MGLPAEGDPLLAAMVAESREQGSRRSTCIWLVTRAEGLVDLDLFDEAQALLDEALALAREVRDDLGEAHCRLAFARVHLGRGALVDATRSTSRRGRVDAHARSGEDLDVLRLRSTSTPRRDGGTWRSGRSDGRRRAAGGGDCGAPAGRRPGSPGPARGAPRTARRRRRP